VGVRGELPPWISRVNLEIGGLGDYLSPEIRQSSGLAPDFAGAPRSELEWTGFKPGAVVHRLVAPPHTQLTSVRPQAAPGKPDPSLDPLTIPK